VAKKAYKGVSETTAWLNGGSCVPRQHFPDAQAIYLPNFKPLPEITVKSRTGKNLLIKQL